MLPSMLLPLAASAAFLLGALGRRVCGGVLNEWTGKIVTGDTPVRLFFGATMALCALMGGAIWWQCPALIPLTFIGTTTGIRGMALGRGDRTYWQDFAWLTLHGVLSAAPAVGAWWLGYAWWWIVAACLSISPLYNIGWSITGTYPNPKLPVGLQAGNEWGEVLWGGAMGVGTFLAVALH